MAAHLVFAVLFVMMLLRRGERREEATLLARVEDSATARTEPRPPAGGGITAV